MELGVTGLQNSKKKLYFICCTFSIPKLLTWRTINLLIVKLQLDRLGRYSRLNQKISTFYFWYFQHTNRKLLTRRTFKLLIVKLQLEVAPWPIELGSAHLQQTKEAMSILCSWIRRPQKSRKQMPQKTEQNGENQQFQS